MRDEASKILSKREKCKIRYVLCSLLPKSKEIQESTFYAERKIVLGGFLSLILLPELKSPETAVF